MSNSLAEMDMAEVLYGICAPWCRVAINVGFAEVDAQGSQPPIRQLRNVEAGHQKLATL